MIPPSSPFWSVDLVMHPLLPGPWQVETIHRYLRDMCRGHDCMPPGFHLDPGLHLPQRYGLGTPCVYACVLVYPTSHPETGLASSHCGDLGIGACAMIVRISSFLFGGRGLPRHRVIHQNTPDFGGGRCAWSVIGQLPENTPHHGGWTPSGHARDMCALGHGAGRRAQARSEGVWWVSVGCCVGGGWVVRGTQGVK